MGHAAKRIEIQTQGSWLEVSESSPFQGAAVSFVAKIR